MPTALKILLVDSGTEAFATRWMLSQVIDFKFELDHAEAVTQAETKLRDNDYDAVLANVNLPGVQGQDAVAALRQAAPTTAIVMMSSSEDRDLIEESVAAGADNYLIKDITDGNRIALGILYARQKRKAKVGTALDDEKYLTALEESIMQEINASGLTMKEALDKLVLALEAYQNNSYRASVMLLRGHQLFMGSAPHLPQKYNDAIEGIEVGPNVGSCGTAAFYRQTIYVVDIDTDRLWRDYREVTTEHGLRACWSVPIIDDDGKLYGTFGLYYTEKRFPSEEERSFIHVAASVAARIIGRLS